MRSPAVVTRLTGGWVSPLSHERTRLPRTGSNVISSPGRSSQRLYRRQNSPNLILPGMISARAHLSGLFGQTIETISGKRRTEGLVGSPRGAPDPRALQRHVGSTGASRE